MASAAQLSANIENAKHSTGPRTEAGKAASASNGITHGLFSRKDFIRPQDEPDYVTLQSGLQTELNPIGVQEQTLVDEIRRATWRLRRCGEVEANLIIRLDDGTGLILDPMETLGQTERFQNSVDRARSQAHRLLHKCAAELRKLQVARKAANSNDAPSPAATKPHLVPQNLQPIGFALSGTARNAPCPCGSGQKHKRCCGRTATAILHVGMNAA